jgi:hypothetical protein
MEKFFSYFFIFIFTSCLMDAVRFQSMILSLFRSRRGEYTHLRAVVVGPVPT